MTLKTCLGRGSRRENEFARHCERSEAIQRAMPVVDCFVASLLAMTEVRQPRAVAGQERRTMRKIQTSFAILENAAAMAASAT